MKNWAQPELAELSINATEDGRNNSWIETDTVFNDNAENIVDGVTGTLTGIGEILFGYDTNATS